METFYLIIGEMVCYSTVLVIGGFLLAILAGLVVALVGESSGRSIDKKVAWLEANGFIRVVGSYCRREDGAKIPDKAIGVMSLKQIIKIFGDNTR